MITKINQTVRHISAKIPDINVQLIKIYIQGAVHSHCNTNPGENISVRILFGGDNKNWAGTPLQWVYDYHKLADASKPDDEAAKDIGWLFKSVLKEDTRTFEYVGKDTGSIYRKL